MTKKLARENINKALNYWRKENENFIITKININKVGEFSSLFFMDKSKECHLKCDSNVIQDSRYKVGDLIEI